MLWGSKDVQFFFKPFQGTSNCILIILDANALATESIYSLCFGGKMSDVGAIMSEGSW